AASAAWRRTNGSLSRSAAANSVGSYTRVSAAASRRASSSVTRDSCCAAPGWGHSATTAASPATAALQANRIGNGLEEVDDMRRDARKRVLVCEGAERRHARGEQLAGRHALDGIPERDAPRRELTHPATHVDQVVVPRRAPVAHAHVGHGEIDTLLLELLVRETRLAHQLRSGAIEPDQVVGVINHAHLVGFGVIDAQGYRADHGEATSTRHLEKSNGTRACGRRPAFLAWGPCLPQPRASSSSPTRISDRSRPRSPRRSIVFSMPSRISATRSSSTA